MWNRKRVLSVVLGIAVTSSSLVPTIPAYAVEIGSEEGRMAESSGEDGAEEESLEGTVSESGGSLEEGSTQGDAEESTKEETESTAAVEITEAEENSTAAGETTEAEEESTAAEETAEAEAETTNSEEETVESESTEAFGEGTQESTEEILKEEESGETTEKESQGNVSGDESKETAENIKDESKESIENGKTETAKESKAPAEKETKKTASPSNAMRREQTHFAVYAGETPDIEGVELNPEDFKEPYTTVTVTAEDGTKYLIEVVPQNILYFVDSGAGDTSPAYEAVNELAGLYNEKADGSWSEDTGWGYVGDVRTKSNAKQEDKNDTGFYGGNNSAGNPISYKFNLEPGTYTITSSHKDWWNMDRPMSMTISYGTRTLNAGSVHSTGVNEYTFTLKEAETVTYTINNTGNQAPIISWVAIAEDPDKEAPVVDLSDPLDDIGEVSVRTGASLQADFESGYMISVTADWIAGGNSAVDGGGVINNAEEYFQKEAFTLYTDFLFNGSHDNTSALLMGNADNHVRLIPRKENGQAVFRVHTNGTDQDYTVDGEISAGTWHSMGVLYSEDEEQGNIILCLDGKQILGSVGIGFKFSQQEEIIAGYGITYKTGFMRTGYYDNIVVAGEQAGVEEALDETGARAEAKKNVNLDRIVIDGSKVEEAAANMNGLTFKGFGVLDCNSTNALLLDYKAQQPEKYWEMMEILFGGEHPIMQHIKIEMGNDKNNSTGSQACTMRYSDEYPDVTRVTGFQLAADAKKINPNVKVSLLYWRAPGWVGSNWDNIYKWMKNTVIAAYREYGYMVDIISPGVNESKDDPNWMKNFKQRIVNDTQGMISSDSSVAGFRGEEAELFRKIQILMSDEVGIASCGPQLVGDQELRDAVDIIGYHYNTDDDSQGNFKKLAEEYDKEIWNSEAQATFGSSADRPNNNMRDNADPGTGIGGNGGPLEMANTVIKGFVNSRRTHFVYQPTFGAFYEGTQYNYKDVMAARDPWSGYVNYDAALNIMQHFTKFAVTGWEYDTPDENVVWRAIPSASKSTATGTNPVNGRNGGDNYMTLASPDKTEFSVIINNDSGKEKVFSIYPRDLELEEGAALEVWETRAADDGQVYNANYMKCTETLSLEEDGTYRITVNPWSIVTVTTLHMADQQEELALPAASEDGRYVLDTDVTGKVQDTTDGYLYADDFDYAEMGNVSDYADGGIFESDKSFMDSRGGRDGFYPLYTQDVNGSFEVVMKDDGDGVLKMNGQTGGSCWNGGEPATILGDYRWTNYKASVDFNLNSTTEYLLLGVRQRGAAGGGDNKVSMSAYNLAVNRTGSWILRRYGNEIARGTVQIQNPSACNVAVRAAGDEITAYIEGKEIYSYIDPNPQLEGRIMLGVGLPGAGWGAGEFDNLKVETVPGYTPYYTMVHDNLHMKKWDGDEAGEDALVYSGSWDHRNQVGSNVSQRSLSSTTQTGAGVSYTFEGTGFALIGPNGGSAKVNVEVDGETVYTDAPTIATASHQPYFVVRGLENGRHTVTVSLASGKLEVDSYGYITADSTVSSNVDVSALENFLASMKELKESDYDPDSWTAYQEALAAGGRFTLEMADSIIADPVSYGADQEGVNEVTAYFETVMDKLTRGDAPVEITSADNLPKMLSVPVGGSIDDIRGGELPETVAVKNMNGTVNEAAEITWKLSGDISQGYNTVSVVGTVTGGKNLTVSIPVEVVPAGLVYFVDPGTEDHSVYDLYKEAAPDLRNETNDKLSENGSWGRNGTNVKSNTNPLDKMDTGLYSGSNIVYTLPLEAGIYTLTAGFTEWWGYGRNMSQTISYTLADGTAKTVSGESVSFGSKGKAVSSTTFVVPEDTTVTYTLAKTGGQDSVISWIGVTKVGGQEEVSWNPVFESNETNQWAGILTQGTVVTKDDPEQGEVLHMNAAGTTYAQIDPKAMDFTGRENMTLSFDLKSETADGNFFTVAIGQDSQKYFFMRTREDDTYMAITKGSYQAEEKAAADVNTYNKWVHVDLVFTPDQIAAYMDGVAVSAINKTVLVTDLGNKPVVYLGRSFYSGDRYFAGAFDNIEVYNRARGGEELALSYVIGKAEKLSRKNYTADSWNAFAKALADANETAQNPAVSADQRLQARDVLQAAMDALVEGTNETDITRLEAAIKEAEELTAQDYTAESWNRVEEALEAAREVLADENADQEQVDDAAEALKSACEALEKKPEEIKPEKADTRELERAVKAAESLTAEDYTAESWGNMQRALRAAREVLEGENPTQKQVDDATEALKAAGDTLVKKNAGGGDNDSGNSGGNTGGNTGGSSSGSSSDDSDDSDDEFVTIGSGRVPLAVAPAGNAVLTGIILSTTRTGTWKRTTDGIWNLVKADGKNARNEWALINNKWYLFDSNARMVQGWAKVNHIWYYCDPVNGDMKTGWCLVGGKWYYLDPVNGDMKTGRLQIEGVWYHLSADGSLIE